MKQTSQIFVNDESFNAYIKYLALKRHFTDKSYDYFKYNGKVRASMDSFRSRPDAYFFAKLAKQDDYENKILANLLVKKDAWIRDILDVEGEENYIQWKKKMDSLGHTFKTDINNMLDKYEENFIVKNGQHPHVLTMFLQNEVSFETFTILSHVANIFDYWDKNLVDKFVAGDIIKKSRKYFPFLNVDLKRYKTIVKDRFL